MKKIAVKIISISILSIFIICIFLNISYGTTSNALQFDSANTIHTVNTPKEATDTSDSTFSTLKLISATFVIVQVIGVCFSIIMIIFSTIKYFISSQSDKTKIKKHIKVFIIITIFLFVSSALKEALTIRGNIQP